MTCVWKINFNLNRFKFDGWFDGAIFVPNVISLNKNRVYIMILKFYINKYSMDDPKFELHIVRFLYYLHQISKQFHRLYWYLVSNIIMQIMTSGDVNKLTSRLCQNLSIWIDVWHLMFNKYPSLKRLVIQIKQNFFRR